MKIIFVIFISLIIKIYSNSIFPLPVEKRTEQEKNCLNVTSPQTIKDCTKIEPADDQEKCCLVSYRDENDTEIQQCGYLEDTQYGIKVYKHLFSSYSKVKIQCWSNFVNINFFIPFLFLIILL